MNRLAATNQIMAYQKLALKRDPDAPIGKTRRHAHRLSLWQGSHDSFRRQPLRLRSGVRPRRVGKTIVGCKPHGNRPSLHPTYLQTRFESMPRQSPLIKLFLDYLTIERGLSANTVQSYGRDLAQLQKWSSANNNTIRGLSNRDIDRHMGALSRKCLNASSIARALSTIRTFY